MRHLGFLLIVFMLLVANAPSLFSQNTPVFELKWDSEHSLDTNILVSVHPSWPKYSLRVTANDSDACLTVCSIFESRIDTMNVIHLYQFYPHRWPPHDLTPVSILFGEDFNFDGYLDLAVIGSIDDRLGTPYYSIWLFHPETRSFQENEDFTEHITWDYVLDSKERTITTNHVDEFRTEDCTTTTYEVARNTLRPIRIESVAAFSPSDISSSLQFVCKLQAISHGQLILVKQAILRTSAEMKQFFKK